MADDTSGKTEHLGGKIKEKTGELLGDRKIQREGQLDQDAGRAEQDQARAERQAEAARQEKLEAEVRKERLDKGTDT